ncbi:BTB/POZ and MATH domain-containing protein 2-like [Lolium rigidum]|uniref:BTB/POZ and MATH domain-containing protein 2-like n=1 Tax=Lolium rigidum TaxID=89674 RepID=UPI001F5D3C33|nr:BTB/POZ and MATH domain-containing protein 2-like [Lolium rigidum]
MAASQQRPTKRIESRCTPATDRATLAFQIVGYSKHKGMGTGECIQSAPASVGGYQWCIRYFPDGSKEEVKDYISVFIKLLCKGPKVRALYDFRLVNHDSGLSSSVYSRSESPQEFNSLDRTNTWGFSDFKKRSSLEQSPYLRDDRLIIECDLTVLQEPLIVAKTVEVQVPPSDLSGNFGQLLETAEGADVAFKVQGEVYHAHKIVLAARSPVFKAELYGPMRDKRRRNIPVQDMQPAVFKALLHFIYTDSLPPMDDLDGDDNKDMVKHLLVAADRYAMERMKIECEAILCKSLDVETVATTLALADQHHCSGLRDACAEFIVFSNRMDDVLASQAYAHLKRSCPAVVVDVLERATKSRKI